MSRTVRGLLLASSALVVAVNGGSALAQAPVDYVRVCDAYGSGFFYIPGTETCLRISGHASAAYLEGPDYRVQGFSFDPQPNVSQNPAFDFDVETEGQRFSAGINLGRLAGLTFGESSTIIRNIAFGFDWIEVEGRSVGVPRDLPTFGIPGVGQDFGANINAPTSVTSNAGVGVEGWAVKGEVTIDLSALGLSGLGAQRVLGDPATAPRNRTEVGLIAGFRYGENETDIGHTAWASTPLFGPDAESWAKYATRVDERSFTPYIGLSVRHTIDLGATNLHFGVSGRVGPSFTDIEVHDSLRADGLGGRLNLVQDIHLQSDETLTYGSLSGMVGISGGPIKVSFVGMAEHGLLNQPNIFRRDTVNVNGVDQPAPTEFDVEEDWSYSVGARLTVTMPWQTKVQAARAFE